VGRHGHFPLLAVQIAWPTPTAAFPSGAGAQPGGKQRLPVNRSFRTHARYECQRSRLVDGCLCGTHGPHLRPGPAALSMDRCLGGNRLASHSCGVLRTWNLSTPRGRRTQEECGYFLSCDITWAMMPSKRSLYLSVPSRATTAALTFRTRSSEAAPGSSALKDTAHAPKQRSIFFEKQVAFCLNYT